MQENLIPIPGFSQECTRHCEAALFAAETISPVEEMDCFTRQRAPLASAGVRNDGRVDLVCQPFL
jgi:hypothetical protein